MAMRVDPTPREAAEAARLVRTARATGRKAHPTLAAWAEDAVPASLSGFDVPAAPRVRLRPTNSRDRIPRAWRRPPRGASLVPNPASCRRLGSALLAALDDAWRTGQVSLNRNP
jgi:transposase-like protein